MGNLLEQNAKTHRLSDKSVGLYVGETKDLYHGTPKAETLKALAMQASLIEACIEPEWLFTKTNSGNVFVYENAQHIGHLTYTGLFHFTESTSLVETIKWAVLTDIGQQKEMNNFIDWEATSKLLFQYVRKVTPSSQNDFFAGWVELMKFLFKDGQLNYHELHCKYNTYWRVATRLVFGEPLPNFMYAH